MVADSGHQKSKIKIKSRYLKSIFKVKSENKKFKVNLQTKKSIQKFTFST